MGYVDLLEEGVAGAMTTEQVEMISTISRNSRRLLDLIEDLLTLSRIESGTFALRSEPVDIRRLVDRMTGELRPRFEARNLTLDVVLAEGTPTVSGDPDQLERALLHVLSNALKFTSDGGHVTVTVTVHDTDVEIVVADTGIGIPADELPRLFQRFFRASTARDVGGTGLGLVVAKRIVDGHRGRIAVTSNQGAGTVASLRLPLDPALADATT